MKRLHSSATFIFFPLVPCPSTPSLPFSSPLRSPPRPSCVLRSRPLAAHVRRGHPSLCNRAPPISHHATLCPRQTCVAAHRLPDAEVHNAAANRTSHCGVLEFIAEEGYVYMPYWVRLPVSGKENGGILEFIADDHMGAVPHWIGLGLPYWGCDRSLEMTLRSFSCLTAGESIMVAYNNKRYFINVVDARPGAAISIIETDCEVDFAPPLDYVEPARAPAAPSQGVAAAPGSGAGDSEGGGKKSAAKDGKAGVYVGMERERGGEEV
ncbi:unnamed protein product [Closterium sp. NIES-65]|nr:unnamed protein product [Closterium sp. NIES-65]